MEEQKEMKLKVDKTIWKEMFRYLSIFKKDFLILCGFMVGLAGMDIVFPLLTRYAIDTFVANGDYKGLTMVGVLYGILALGLGIIVFLFIRHAGKIEMGIVYKLRKDAFEKLQRLSFSYYDKNAVGWMIARTTSDATKISETVAWGVVDLVWGATMMLGVSVVMLLINWKLALVTLITVPVLALVSVFFEKKMLVSYRNVRKINSKITGLFNDGIVGAKTTKTLVREELNIEEFQDVTKDMKKTSIRAATLSAGYLPMTLFISAVGTVLTLLLGSNFLIEGTLTYGTLVLFITYARQFFDPILEIARIYTEMIGAQAAAERVMGLLHEKEEIVDTEAEDKEDYGKIHGDVTFENVSFFYKEGEYILKNFNLQVKSGETIALVGETGSGKSTIVNLACRFYEPSEGKILIDGEDYKKRPQSWLHQNIGYVLQAPHLFSGTIKENIRYGKLTATDEDIIEAAKVVHAHEFIMKLEKGYDTEVGEGGGMLSTGEKQLISFARAIIGKPRLFFLDEATSSIDTESEAKIQKAIEEVLENRTSFIVAHRLSTIKNADRILVIDQGEILEEGNHEELLKKRGHYYELYTNQFVEEAGREVLKGKVV
ncbi:ABC transporter ATP-binding protein [Proteiniclasticum ruminis]|uniref:ATP-binding cassette, subfamily B n=1 Tax=Proteiniclasticum ruminis TaxID=398199 RepID=A0A1G8PB38_9CLOT|nr:ABC transporter ATP-binding protein [Proteiniclasticum ruminis]SDI89515.1 ATP-binding cassette, subfamily B [Proteiniclasticum ruminis]